MGKGIKINYLFNSGFAVETPSYLLIFDYYIDSVESGNKSISNGAVGEVDLEINKKIIVFSSHSHPDHFNPQILEWSKKRADIEYVLSDDIEVNSGLDNINLIGKYQELLINDVHIKTFGSTDIGISFLVNVDSITLFHSGDLNWWYWWDDGEEEIKYSERYFKDEINKIKGEEIDIAFFPVDPRLEHNYSVGGQYFIKELNPKSFIPMHFGKDYSTTKKFKEKMKDCETKIYEIEKRGQEIKIEVE